MTEIADAADRSGWVRSSGRAAARSGASRWSDDFFHRLTQGAALVVLLILGGVIGSLIKGSIPAFQKFGFGFFTTQVWNPVTEKFGALAPIYGTLVTSAIAMADRGAAGHGDRRLSDRALSACLASTDRHRHRAIGRNPKHHLRHLGLVRFRPVSPATICSHFLLRFSRTFRC